MNDLLFELARRPVITHESLNALPSGRTLHYVRGLFIEHHAFPRRDAIDRAIHSDEMTSRNRLAAMLVLVFGQQIEKVATLTLGNITLTDDAVHIDLAGVLDLMMRYEPTINTHPAGACG